MGVQYVYSKNGNKIKCQGYVDDKLVAEAVADKRIEAFRKVVDIVVPLAKKEAHKKLKKLAGVENGEI